MAQLLNIRINENKEFKNAISNIFGFSSFQLILLYKILGINIRKKWLYTQLNVKQISSIRLFLPNINIFDSDLRRKISVEYNKFFELKCYKKLRFSLGLPVRGQRTKSNAKNAKKCKQSRAK